MEHKVDLARIDADMEDMCDTMKDGIGEVFVKVKDILEVKTKKYLLEMNSLTQTQQTEMIDKTPVVVLLKVEEIGEQPSIHDINALKHNTKDSDNKDTTKTITGPGELLKDKNSFLIKPLPSPDT